MGKDDDLPIFRPKFGRADRASNRGAGGGFRNAVLAGARLRRRLSGGTGRGAALRVAASPPTALSRRVVIKAHVVKMTAYGAKAARLHLRYIERDGVEKDGSPGKLYGADGPAEGMEESREGEKHQFRFIVSPEDAGELDLKVYVRELMAQVEKDTGRRLEWAAVNHYDTDHPHAHVVVRGVDRDGQAVRFDRAYMGQGMRRRAQEIATRELGPRTEREVKRAQVQEVTRERFTSVDAVLERRARDREVVVPRSAPPSGGSGVENAVLVARLEHLETMRLAERVAPNRWRLAERWSEQLREMGSRGDVIKQMHQALRGDPARYRIVRPGQGLEREGEGPGRPRIGRVAAKGLSDELRGAFYAVLETPAGEGYHVPLDRAAAEALRVGDVVTFATERGDRAGRAEARARVVVNKYELGLEAQVTHAGPVALDRLSVEGLALYGFGAEVRRAIERREAQARQWAIEPGSEGRIPRLRELEARAIADRVARRLGQAVLSETPGSFRGRVEACERGADGTAYAVIRDGVQLVVVPATQEPLPQKGKLVAASMDKDGTWRIRSLDQDRHR